MTNSPSSSSSSEKKTADDYKQLGNDAFAKQDYQSAIEHYTKAIQLDRTNHIYYSNRSASYASIKVWDKSLSDAKECLKLNPQFVKGYYRLSIAQYELQDYMAAEQTIQRGLGIDKNNPQLVKVLRSIKQQQSKERRMKNNSNTALAAGAGVNAATSANTTNTAQLDTATMQEVRDLQIQYDTMVREYQSSQVDYQRAQREEKMYTLTANELSLPTTTIPSTTQSQQEEGSTYEKENNTNNHNTGSSNTDSSSTPSRTLYRSVGKLFVHSTTKDITDHIATNVTAQQMKQKECTARMEYIQKRVTSIQLNIRELTGNSSTSTSNTTATQTVVEDENEDDGEEKAEDNTEKVISSESVFVGEEDAGKYDDDDGTTRKEEEPSTSTVSQETPATTATTLGDESLFEQGP